MNDGWFFTYTRGCHQSLTVLELRILCSPLPPSTFKELDDILLELSQEPAFSKLQEIQVCSLAAFGFGHPSPSHSSADITLTRKADRWASSLYSQFFR